MEPRSGGRHATPASVRVRERALFDEQARQPGALTEPDSAPRFDARFERTIMEAAGELEGLQVLDLGCGSGDLTFRLLDAGAMVTALELSPGQLNLAKRRIERFRPEAQVEFVEAPAEETGLPVESFDLVVGKWILHHLDLPSALDEVRRLLRPHGRGVFVETSALNPVLAFMRRHVVGRCGTISYGTPDEHPISWKDIALMRARFSRCEIDFPDVVFFLLLDRHVLRWRFDRLSRWLEAGDHWIQSRASLGRISYYVRIQLKR